MKRCAMFFSITAFLVTSTSAALAQSARPAINVAYSSEAGPETALWVAKNLGLFEKYGLDVTPKRLAGSSLIVQAMLAKEISIAQIGGTAVVDARLAGADIVYLASVIGTMVASIHSLPSITKLEDLRGQKIAVTRFGAITDFFARYAMKTKGFVAGKDYSVVQTNDMPNSLTALKLGTAQAGLLTAPLTAIARKQGFPELVDMTKIGGAFPFNGVATTREYLNGKENREILRRFMKGWIEGISVALKNREQTLKIISHYTRTTDQELLEEAYDVTVGRAFLKSPYPLVDGFKAIFDFVAETRDPKAKNFDPKAFLDASFVKELDDSGFLKSLF
ncbi:MAG: ABC transporter substrate-binding protein [Deltaproteobacteria bacterium]|nr:ABC transporter substrate-binding protein [Deltaproteobacteria bacterium]